jgi:hypothetical protein
VPGVVRGLSDLSQSVLQSSDARLAAWFWFFENSIDYFQVDVVRKMTIFKQY